MSLLKKPSGHFSTNHQPKTKTNCAFFATFYLRLAPANYICMLQVMTD